RVLFRSRRRSLPGVPSKIPDDAFSCTLALNKHASALIALRGSDLRRGQKPDVSGCVFAGLGFSASWARGLKVPSTWPFTVSRIWSYIGIDLVDPHKGFAHPTTASTPRRCTRGPPLLQHEVQIPALHP